MDHIAHLRDQFKSMKTFEQSYDYMYIYIIKLAQYFWGEDYKIKLAQYLRRRLLNFVNYFCKYRYHLSLEKGVALQYEYLKSSSPKDAFLPSLVEIGSLVLEKKISKIRQCIFTISYLSSLGKTAEHII